MWWIFITLVSSETLGELNCRAPGPQVPGLTERCDRTLECANFCERNHYTLDFLCCESEKGWISMHVMAPMIFYLYWQNVTWTILAFLLNEFVEIVWLTFYSPVTNIGVTDFETTETIAAAFIGDVFLCGTIGLLLGFFLASLWGAPPLASSSDRIVVYRKSGWWKWLRLIIWLIHQTLAAVILAFVSFDTPFFGLNWALVIDVVFIAIIHPFWITADRRSGVAWTPGTSYFTIFGFFGSWLIISTLIHGSLIVGGTKWLANDWYIVWLIGAILIALVGIAALIVAPIIKNGTGGTQSGNRKLPKTGLQTSKSIARVTYAVCLTVALIITFVMIGLITNTGAWQWIALGLAVIVIFTSIWLVTELWGSNPILQYRKQVFE